MKPKTKTGYTPGDDHCCSCTAELFKTLRFFVGAVVVIIIAWMIFGYHAVGGCVGA
jgi:hypothetical protein